MHTEKLYDLALIEPATNGADELLVIGGYASAPMAIRHIHGVPREGVPGLPSSTFLRITHGMFGSDGIDYRAHKQFCQLQLATESRCQIRYYDNRPACHAKVYVWYREKEPIQAFQGSANYSQNAFDRRTIEVLDECNPTLASRFGEHVWEHSTNVLHISKTKKQSQRVIKAVSLADARVIELPLTPYGKGDSTPMGSGINWSFRGRRSGKEWIRQDKNQAYIHVPTDVCRIGFFPPRNELFLLGTDDGEVFVAVTAQPKRKGEPADVYGAIETPESNSLLGRYFRTRIGKHLGLSLLDQVVTLEHLKAYGRLTVSIRKMSDDTYAMDFSPKSPIP